MSGDEVTEDEIINYAISGGYTLNADNTCHIFPLRNSEAVVYIGTKMEVNKIYGLINYSTENPNQGIEIICYEWQAEYYEKLLTNGNITVTVLSENS